MAVEMHAAPPTTPGKSFGARLPAVDGLRALAALAVLTTHVAFHTGAVTAPVLGPVVSRLDLGVCVFFLLSGFLLYHPWASSAMSGGTAPGTRDYARRRWARIYPAYALVVVVVLGWYSTTQVPASQWLAYLSLTQIYVSGVEQPQLTQMWSVATEAAFYLVLPVLGWIATRRHRGSPARSERRQWALLAGLVATAFAFHLVRAWTTLLPDWLSSFWLPVHLDWFAAGMALALVRARITSAEHEGGPLPFHGLRLMARDWVTCLGVAGLLYVIACTPIAGKFFFDGQVGADLNGPWAAMIKHYLYAGTAFFLLLPIALGAGRSGYERLLSSPPLQRLGTVSYGLFLWHLLLISMIADALGLTVFGGGFWLLWPLTFLASLVPATLSWRFVERPALRWAARRSARPAPGLLASSPAP